MSGTTEQFEGGCLCGAVRFVATGQPKGVYWCHCQSCRKHSGAPVSVFVAYEHSAYSVTGEITKFDSTPARTRWGVLRPLRLDVDLREPARGAGDGNAFPCRRF